MVKILNEIRLATKLYFKDIIPVKVDTYSKYKLLMDECDKNYVPWMSGVKASDRNHWDEHKDHTAILFNYTHIGWAISYGRIGYYYAHNSYIDPINVGDILRYTQKIDICDLI